MTRSGCCSRALRYPTSPSYAADTLYPLASRLNCSPVTMFRSSSMMRILGISTASTLKRNAEGEPASASWLALDLHAASMRLDDVLDQGQAEAAARSCSCLLGAGAVELAEDVRQV